MFKLEKNKLLTPYTTLKIGSPAEFFTIVRNQEDLQEAIIWAREHQQKIWILGGGSNILLTKKIKGLVIKNEIRGIKIIKENKKNVFVEAQAGEAWMKLVNFTIQHKLFGLENLSLIYGTVGAAPIQNIGAYGVELKDVFHSLRAINLQTGQEKIFLLNDCQFAYRDSIFKNRLKGKYFICSLVLKLKKKAKLILDYGGIRKNLLIRGIQNPRQQDLIQTIQELRQSKLPNPGLLPNAGSFFKNPILAKKKFAKIQKKYPQLPGFPINHGQQVKIPAAWLIEQAGFKGKRFGPVAMSETQALVLVNYQQAQAKQVLSLVKKIKTKIKKDFTIDLEEEVNII